MTATPRPTTPLLLRPHGVYPPRAPAHPAAPTPPVPAVPALSCVEVVWRVGRRCLGLHAPAGSSRVVELAIRVQGLGGTVTGGVTVADGAHTRVIETFAGVRAEVIPDIRAQLHIECPGVLHATIGAEPQGWRLVYARTPLLDAMGIPGGRAEPVGVRVS